MFICRWKNLPEIPLETDSEDEDGRSVTSDPVETVDIIETWEAEGSEDEDGRSVTSDPVETVDIIETVWEAEGSEDEANWLVDVQLEEEEPEELRVLLPAQGDSEEPHNSVNGVEINGEGEEAQEEEEEEEEKRVTNVLYADDSEEANTVSCPSDV